MPKDREHIFRTGGTTPESRVRTSKARDEISRGIVIRIAMAMDDFPCAVFATEDRGAPR